MDYKKTTSISKSICDLPFIGHFTKGTANGFSFINNSIDEDLFAHINKNFGNHVDTMESLDLKDCAFVLGGDPFAYKNQKPKWKDVVIGWKLLSEIESIDGSEVSEDDYNSIRKESFQRMDLEDFINFLGAAWYQKQWRVIANTNPKTFLKRDSIIEQTLLEKITKCSNLNEIERLFYATERSFWFPESNEELIAKYFLPKYWNDLCFKSFDTSMGNSNLYKRFKNEIDNRIISNKSISIDLESNGSKIFQYGWYSRDSNGLIKEDKGITNNQVIDAVNESISSKNKSIVVGHNFLSWDKPILEKHDVNFNNDIEYWDTLIMSLLLGPWKPTHALINPDSAHQADSDAETCYSLFDKQVTLFYNNIYFYQDGNPSKPIYDTERLIDIIFLDPEIITDIIEDFPNKLDGEIKTLDKCDILIIPENLIKTIGWNKSLYIKIDDAAKRASNPILDINVCKKVAEEYQDLYSKLLFIIVFHSSRNNVKVFLSMLPKWLVNKELKSLLIQKHAEAKTPEVKSASTLCLLISDLINQGEEQQKKILNGRNVFTYSKSEVLSSWMALSKKEVKEKEVLKDFPEIQSQIKGRSLFHCTNNGDSLWYFYDPPGLQDAGPMWTVFDSMPQWIEQLIEQPQPYQSSNLKILFPQWTDGDTKDLQLERIFVSPDTHNRILYLSDVTERVLNIIESSKPKNKIHIIAMKWSSEAIQLQNNLEKLGYSANHSTSHLRNLEFAKDKGYKALVCNYSDLPNYLRASEELNCSVKIVVDEMPINDWYVLLNTFENNFKSKAIHKVSINTPILNSLIDKYLINWIDGITKNTSFDPIEVVMLDSRFFGNLKTENEIVNKIEISFFPISELLPKKKREIFYEVCYPKRNVKQIPNDYDTYKKFLHQNWGYKDFIKGTQKPAIEKIINSKKDILLRLPTGAGKSIIFHLPALLRSNFSGKLTIVITPLRALMKDQVDGLRERNFHESVDYLSGGREAIINYEVYQGVLDGRIKVLFVAPERFRVEKFIDVIERRRRMDSGLEYIVFDEAHCISEWGYEFRPDYLYASQYVAENFKLNDGPGNPHRLLLTSATVTERNRIDIQKELEIGDKNKYHLLPDDMPHPIQSFIKLKSFDLIEDEEDPLDDKGKKMIEILSELDLKNSAALIFVRRRKDCHRISELLNEKAQLPNTTIPDLNALPFHAGLSESIKSESVQLLKDKDVNVLVCTKAFGMGMDIPHIHASIHHRPTTFIEDYLQEVGRIGRDEAERKRSKLNQVEGSVFFNQENIDTNLSMLNSENISHLDLLDFFDYVKNIAIKIDDVDKSIGIIESKVNITSSKVYNETQVSNILFWLERMRVITIEGRHPPALKLSINLGILKNIADDNSLSSTLAQVLIDNIYKTKSFLEKLRGKTNDYSNADTGSIFNRFVKGILNGVFSLVQAPLSDKSKTIPNERDEIELNIGIEKLLSELDGITRDELYSLLIELSKSNAVTLKKSFIVSMQNGQSDISYYRLLNKSLDILLNIPTGTVFTLERRTYELKLKKWYKEYILSISDENELTKYEIRKINREVIRVINTSLRILRYINAEVIEKLTKDGVPVYSYTIPPNLINTYKSQSKKIVENIKKMCELIRDVKNRSKNSDGEGFEVEIEEILIEFDDSDLSFSKIMQIIKLVESSGFYAFDSSMDDWITVISFKTNQSLEDFDINLKKKNKIQDVYQEMELKNELQQLRAQSMVLLLAMPEENRREFIDLYFESKDIKSLQKLMEDTVGNIPEDILENNIHLTELLAKVRRERFTNELKELNLDQRKVCESNYDNNILVNAGPGSGKTHVLMMRCAHLIHKQKLDPSEILVLSFNRAVVFEIKDRIAKLFRSIGYGSFTDKLKVFTFHSFAMQHIQFDDEFDESAINDKLGEFAEKMKEKDFAKNISKNYKAILIDEFQDMNEDFFNVINNLIIYCGGSRNNRGGGMVIGDDDQDILVWNRKAWMERHNKNSPLHAIHYFKRFNEQFEPKVFRLNKNYRSAVSIVERANSMIDNVSNKIGFERMKEDSELVTNRKEKGYEGKFHPDELEKILLNEISDDQSSAILCRSNIECRLLYDDLLSKDIISDDSIDLVSSFDLSLFNRRDCGAIMDICNQRNEYDFVELYAWEEIIAEYLDKNHAQSDIGKEYLNTIYNFIKKEVGRPKVRDIKNFISEMKNSDVERLVSKSDFSKKNKIKISTIHRVKGLEFDNVIIMPSRTSFPFSQNTKGSFSKDDVAEESRLYFVAITRAKNRLYMGWGKREAGWYNSRSVTSDVNKEGFLLKGEPSEFFASWPGRDLELQNFIESKVNRHDIVTLSNGNFKIGDKTITRLSSKAKEKVSSGQNFRVSDVMRYNCGEYFRTHNEKYYEPLCNEVKQRQWYYLPLIEQV
mgnify:CR=1 FL=1